MFYRVKTSEKISDTYVFDNLTPASAVFEVFQRNHDRVTLEMVQDDGTVVWTDVVVRESDEDEYQRLCREGGYNEHGFKVGSF